MKEFNAVEVKDKCVQWIRDFFEQNGKYCNAVAGVSGDINSSVTAALCVEALGKDRVKVIVMPNGSKSDTSWAYFLCGFLDIKFICSDIEDTIDSVLCAIPNYLTPTRQTRLELPAMARTIILYSFSQCMNGLIADTSNLSERWIEYPVLQYTPNCFSPLANFITAEVKEIGKVLGLPDYLIDSSPEDDTPGRNFEKIFGFSHEVLDRYIRTGKIDDIKMKEKIDAMHEEVKFRSQPIASFQWDEQIAVQ